MRNYEDFIKVDAEDYTQDLFNDLDQYLLDQDRLYAKGEPVLTDSQYDELLFLAKELTPKFGPVQSLNQVSDFIQGDVPHRFPMLSLNKTKSLDELKSFLDKFSSDPNNLWYTNGFIVQHKEDGLTIVIDYHDGQLTLATRGDGYHGVDVTDNLRCLLDGITFDRDITIRCEAIIDQTQFDQINQDGKYQNARNLVAGTIMKKDPEISKKRGVKLNAYTIENALELGFTTELDALEYLSKLMPNITKPLCPLSKLASQKGPFSARENGLLSKEEVIELVKSFTPEMRQAVGHDIDGLVIKPNYTANREQIGYTNHHPKNQLAYKFESPNAITTLREVRWQIGASGQYTPVGVFDPVSIGGAVINQASLANLNNIVRRDLRLGDTILIQRSNDVIPQIVKPIYEDLDERLNRTSPVELPENAKLVGGLVYAKEQTPEQLVNRWIRFTSRKAMNIQGLSKETVIKLSDHGVIDLKDLSSLYRMDKDSFIAIEGLGEKSWQNLQDQLKRSKDKGLASVLIGLGIDQLGSVLAKAIAQKVKDFKQLLDYKDNLDALNIQGLGPKKQEAIRSGLFQDETIQLLSRLEASGVSLTSKENLSSDTGELSGLVFVLTGSFSQSRSELSKQIEAKGGRVTSSVTKNTDYLVLNEDSQSKKVLKARELGIKEIDEEYLTQNFL